MMSTPAAVMTLAQINRSRCSMVHGGADIRLIDCSMQTQRNMTVVFSGLSLMRYESSKWSIQSIAFECERRVMEQERRSNHENSENA